MGFYKPDREDEIMKLNEQLAGKTDYTAEDIRKLPEDVRAELIDGQIYYLASPKTRHQNLVVQFSTELNSFIRQNGGACKVFVAPTDVCLDGDDKTLLEPDIFVVCDKKKIHEDACYGAPDLVIEITSKSTRKRDYGIKMMKYRTAGVKEYWVVDPDRQTVLVSWFEDESVNCLYSFEDEISFRSFPNVKVRIQDWISQQQKGETYYHENF